MSRPKRSWTRLKSEVSIASRCLISTSAARYRRMIDRSESERSRSSPKALVSFSQPQVVSSEAGAAMRATTCARIMARVTALIPSEASRRCLSR